MWKGGNCWRRLAACLLVFAATSAAGCNTILGVHDLQSAGDAAIGGDSSADGGADAPPSTVHGTALDQCYGAPQVATPTPEDLSGYTIQAYVPDGSPSGFHIINGTGTKDGTFTIPDVDDGPYLLAIIAPDYALPAFYETRSRAPDIGYARVGRCAGSPVTEATPVTFQISGLAPWELNDWIQIDSFSGAMQARLFTGPELGGSSIGDVAIDWKRAAPWLLDGGSDDLVISQYRRDFSPVDGLPSLSKISTRVETAHVAQAPGLMSGIPAEIAAQLMPSANRAYSYGVMPAAWLNGLDPQPLIPFYFVIRQRADLTAEATHSFYGMAGTEVPVYPQPYLVAGGDSYSDVFPADWARYTVVNPAIEWPIASRSGFSATLSPGGTFERRTATVDTFAEPSIGAVHGIRVMGQPANRARAIPFDGGGVVSISWEPVVAADRYLLNIWRINEAAQVSSVDSVAELTTSQSVATLPASLFVVGGAYAITVTSVKGSTDYAGGVLRRNGFPVSKRDAATARLLFASSCGNGAVDAEYEECDSSGVATSTCNADCSRTRCGDAIVNVAAGEVCDDGRDSFICDSDCTPPVCGDGHVNATTEACDDHNSISGDGCSVGCAVEPGYSCVGSPSVCTKN